MKISTMMYLFLNAMKNLKRNMILTIVSIITISLILFIFGVFIIYILSVDLNIEQIDRDNRTIVMLVKYIKFILLIILPPISVLLITNEMKMIVYTRRNEISIMKFLFIFSGTWLAIISNFIVLKKLLKKEIYER